MGVGLLGVLVGGWVVVGEVCSIAKVGRNGSSSECDSCKTHNDFPTPIGSTKGFQKFITHCTGTMIANN